MDVLVDQMLCQQTQAGRIQRGWRLRQKLFSLFELLTAVTLQAMVCAYAEPACSKGQNICVGGFQREHWWHCKQAHALESNQAGGGMQAKQ